MYSDKKIWIAQSDKNIYLNPSMANRHGLIAGATGTGKTITMKVMAESFSDMGVPVFLADVKGDLSGMCKPGKDSEDMQSRIAYFGAEGFEFKSFPTRFWDIFGEYGIPVRVTISEMGPTLLSRLLGLTDVQTGVLNIVFKVADEQGLLLLVRHRGILQDGDEGLRTADTQGLGEDDLVGVRVVAHDALVLRVEEDVQTLGSLETFQLAHLVAAHVAVKDGVVIVSAAGLRVATEKAVQAELDAVFPEIAAGEELSFHLVLQALDDGPDAVLDELDGLVLDVGEGGVG